MLIHFRDDWERIVDGGFHLPFEELVEYRKALPRESFRGEYVKSYGEKLIANTLFGERHRLQVREQLSLERRQLQARLPRCS